jgi:hypothetical protein
MLRRLIFQSGTRIDGIKLSRFRLALALLGLSLLTTGPALLAAGGALWLSRLGMATGNPLAWVTLIFLIPVVIGLGCLAFFTNTALLAGLYALIRGKPVVQMTFGRTAYRTRHYRDVHPIDVQRLENRPNEESPHRD